jgi:hypothetical protein
MASPAPARTGKPIRASCRRSLPPRGETPIATSVCRLVCACASHTQGMTRYSRRLVGTGEPALTPSTAEAVKPSSLPPDRGPAPAVDHPNARFVVSPRSEHPVRYHRCLRFPAAPISLRRPSPRFLSALPPPHHPPTTPKSSHRALESVNFRALLHRRVRSARCCCQHRAPYPSMGFVPLQGPTIAAAAAPAKGGSTSPSPMRSTTMPCPMMGRGHRERTIPRPILSYPSRRT